MADAVEVFRENGAKVRAMTEAEIDRAARSQAQRASMMQTLQREFATSSTPPSRAISRTAN